MKISDVPDAKDVVTLDAGAVSDEEDSALPLGHEQVRRVLTRHCAEIPAEKKKKKKKNYRHL